jgi:hypothetical protein
VKDTVKESLSQYSGYVRIEVLMAVRMTMSGR